MAVRTYRSEVLRRVNPVIAANLTQRLKVMNVDEANPEAPIYGLELESTDGAREAMMLNALQSCSRIAFEPSCSLGLLRSFEDSLYLKSS